MASFGKFQVKGECPSCHERGVSITIEWDNGDYMTPPHREARVDTGICECGHVLSEEQQINVENAAFEGEYEPDEPEGPYDTLAERDMDRMDDDYDFSPDES